MSGKPVHIRIDPAEMQRSIAESRRRSRQQTLRWQDFRRGLITAEEYAALGGAVPIDEDGVGLVAEYTGDGAAAPGQRFYLTPCCGASAKGMEDYVGCRNCYEPIDPALGGIPPNGDTVDVDSLPEWAVNGAGEVVGRWMSAGMNLGKLHLFIAAALAAVAEEMEQ